MITNSSKPEEATYHLPQSLAEALVNYLVQRPYAEVFQLLNSLTALVKAESSVPTLTIEPSLVNKGGNSLTE